MSVYELRYKVNLALPDPEGFMGAEVREILRTSLGKNKQILLAYPPKVGGTFMRTAVIHLLRGNYTAYLNRGSYANTDQSRDLYFPTLLDVHVDRSQPPAASVMHLHMFPARHLTEMIEAFDIPVVIGTRSILDCLRSSIDMTTGMEAEGEFVDDTLISNGKPYAEMTAEERRHGIVHTVPLWYARFYGQWLRYDRECEAQGKRRPLWLTFQEFKEEPAAVLARIARHVDPGNRYDAAAVDAALAKSLEKKAGLRFNKGVSGRGQGHFTDDEQRTIYATLAKAGEEDLLRLGVLEPMTVTAERQESLA